jgi:phosphate-selective porin OprO/OprP
MRGMMTRILAVSVLFCGLIASNAVAQPAQREGLPGNSNPLSFAVGDAVRFNLIAKIQSDFHNLSADVRRDPDLDEGFDLTRRRIGIEGVFLKHFEFQIEREIRKDDPWRDVFVDFQYFSNAQVRSGKFKLPFGMDQLTNPTRLDFIHRSRVGDLLSPGRDIGAAVHGRFWGRGLTYEAGVFQHDGDKSRFKDNPGADLTGAGRVTARPFRLLKTQPLRSLELGANATLGNVSEGLHGLRGQTTFRDTFFESVYVNGRRVRVGTDMNWTPGPFSVKTEMVRVQDERRGQGLLGENLPELNSSGWYLSGTWLATGEQKSARVEPRRPLFQGGIGGIELAARYEEMRFGSRRADTATTDGPSSHPRAAHLSGVNYRAWTLGVNWYLNHWVRAQANVVRESGMRNSFSDEVQESTIEPLMSYVFRLQFSL